MKTRDTPSTAAFIAAFASIYLIWGSTYLGIRVAISSIPPFAMASARFILAGGLLFVFLRVRGAAWPTRRQCRDSLIVGTCLLVGGNGLLAIAEQTIPSGISALMVGICPLFMVLTEWAWPGGLRPTLGTFAGLLLGFCGVVWLAAPWENPARGGLPLSGVALLLASCLSWAIGSIYSRHVREPAPAMMGSALQMFFGGLALGVAALLHGEFPNIHLNAITAKSWWAFVYLIAIGAWVGFSTFVWLMKHTTPARVSTYAYVNPVVAVFLGWWLLDEPISARTLFAALIIVVAVAIITLQKAKKTAPKASEVVSTAPTPPLTAQAVRRS